MTVHDRTTLLLVAAAGLVGGAAYTPASFASSHREAPLIAEDPAMDPTDFYMFRGPSEDPEARDTVTFIANYWPLEEPGGGPNFPRFATDVYYRILIDNDGDAKEDIVYQLSFETRNHAANDSFLYNRGPITGAGGENLLVEQTATLVRIETKGGKRTEQKGIPVAPIFTGAASYPAAGGKTSEQVYDDVAARAVTPLTTRGGGKIFLGPRDDPFFADLGFVFDLLQIRGGAPGGAGKGGGIDYLAGYNVHTIAIQVPISALTRDGSIPPHGKASILGAWTGGWRHKTTTIGPDNKRTGTGYQQVSRLGIPLVNEVLLPVGVKDFFNASSPKDDARNAAGFLQDPELARLFKLLYKLPVPGKGRTDIINLISFNLGVAPLDVPGLQPADILRLDVSVPAGSLNPRSRLGLLAGDPDGFPNGRRLADDVVDIAERVVAGALCTKGKTCDVDPVTVPLGDAVDQNDKPFLTRFPYVAAPWGGSAGTAIHGKPAGKP